MLKLVRTQAPPAPKAARTQSDDLTGLVGAVVAGQPGAARTFTVAVGPHLLRVVRRILGRRHPDIEDVTQEAAFAVIEALPRYRSECTVLHFACRVAVLTAMNVRRREAANKRASLRPCCEEVENLSTATLSPEASVTARDTAEAVRELIAELPELQAETLALHCALGYTVTEIAGTTGVPVETIRSRLRLARRAMRQRLQADPLLRERIGGVR